MTPRDLLDIEPWDPRARDAHTPEDDDRTVEETLLSHLDPLFEDHLIVEVVRPIKSGKEAVVYCCRADASLGGGLIAAKIYRPVERRSFKQDRVYQQGRERGARPDARTLRALGKKTQRGRLHKFNAWIAHEFRTLMLLHQAGADVPEPIERVGPVILMEYLGEPDHPAPVLVGVAMERDEAAAIYGRVLENVELFLKCHRVHADLSAYNMLYHRRRVVIIDFPQAVDPRYNDDAFDLLLRDLRNANAFFAAQGVSVSDPLQTALSFWRTHIDPLR